MFLSLNKEVVKEVTKRSIHPIPFGQGVGKEISQKRRSSFNFSTKNKRLEERGSL